MGRGLINICQLLPHLLPLLFTVVKMIKMDFLHKSSVGSELSARLFPMSRESWTGAVRSKAASSAFSTHRDCTPSFDDVKILNRAAHHQMRLLLESAYIRTVGRRQTVLVSPNDSNVNRNSGTLLQDRWLPVIRSFCLH